MPSPPRLRSTNAYDKLIDIEAQLRYAQACDALSELRQSLCVRAHLSTYKLTVRGQRPNTRAQSLLAKAEGKTLRVVEKYRQARQAYQRLMNAGPWENTLKPLWNSDIRMLTDADPDDLDRRGGPSEGHRQVSWIWKAPGTSSEGGTEMNEGKHIYCMEK